METGRTMALAMVAAVQQLAQRSQSEFQRLNYEWSLTPDDWLKIKFLRSSSNSKHRPARIQVSLGMEANSLPPEVMPLFRKERWPGWSLMIVNDQHQLPALLGFLKQAFYLANSDHRNRHGKPVRRSMVRRA